MKKRTQEEMQLNGIIWIFAFILTAMEGAYWVMYYLYIRPWASEHPDIVMPIVLAAFFAIGLSGVIYALRRMKARPGRKAMCTMETTGRICGKTPGLKYPVLDFGHFTLVLKEKIDTDKYKETREIEVLLNPEGTEVYLKDDKEAVKSDRFFLVSGLLLLAAHTYVLIWAMQNGWVF